MNLLEIIKWLGSCPYWRDPMKMKLKSQYQGIFTVIEIINKLESGEWFVGDQFETYAHNIDGIWGISQGVHLSREPIFKHVRD